MLEKIPEGLGHALINQRAGMEHVVYNVIFHAIKTERIEVDSNAFAFNARIPARFTADGAGLSPPLTWRGLPAGTTSVAVIVEDADAPTPHPLVHAIVVNLAACDGGWAEGDLASPHHRGIGLTIGLNSFLSHAWLPPDPPRGHGEHRYVFQVFALGGDEHFAAQPGRGELVKALRERCLGSGCVIGTYERDSESAVAGNGLMETGQPVGT